MAIHTRVMAAVAVGLILAGCTESAHVTKATSESCTTVSDGPRCLDQSGCRVKIDGCGAIGQTYTLDQIRRTGAVTPGEALPPLDSAITVHH